MWGNPTTDAEGSFTLQSSRPFRGLPSSIAIRRGEGPRVIENLVAESEGDVELRVMDGGTEIARANPLRVAKAATLKRYWGDLHGQSGETVGMGSAEDYFR